MRTDILEYFRFYASPLGKTAAGLISARMREVWGPCNNLRVAGFGFVAPFLSQFPEAERRIAFAPSAQGVAHWPQGERNAAALVAETRWPVPDASIDRLIIIHGLEESPEPQRLMREAWRVLTNDGRLLIVAAHRRGVWSMIETTPFAAGRPYLRGQLHRLVEGATFAPPRWNRTLFIPPFSNSFLLGGVNAWERAGARLWPGLAGVLMAETGKDILAPTGFVRAVREPRRRAGVVAPRPAGAGRNAAQS